MHCKERLRECRAFNPALGAVMIAKREGTACASDGSITLERPLADAEWGIRHVLQYGPDAELVETVRLREEIKRQLLN